MAGRLGLEPVRRDDFGPHARRYAKEAGAQALEADAAVVLVTVPFGLPLTNGEIAFSVRDDTGAVAQRVFEGGQYPVPESWVPIDKVPAALGNRGVQVAPVSPELRQKLLTELAARRRSMPAPAFCGHCGHRLDEPHAADCPAHPQEEPSDLARARAGWRV